MKLADASSPTPPARPKAAAADAASPAKASGTTVAARSSEEAAASRDDADPLKGWKIQVGATDDPGKAVALLDKARARDRALLAAAKPLTEKVRKGEDTFYRARFAGLELGNRRRRLPLPQAQRLLLLCNPRLSQSVPSPDGSSSEHPWPD